MEQVLSSHVKGGPYLIEEEEEKLWSPEVKFPYLIATHIHLKCTIIDLPKGPTAHHG